MALSLSLARTAPLAAVSAGPGARRLPATSLAFPPKSLFGAPLAAAAASVASPLPRKPATTSLAVVAAGKKGYKMKTHKVSAKRFRVTGRGKIVRRSSLAFDDAISSTPRSPQSRRHHRLHISTTDELPIQPGTMDELKELAKIFHEAGIKEL